MLGLTAQAWYDILYMILLAVAFVFTNRVIMPYRYIKMGTHLPDQLIAAIAWAALIVFYFN